MSTLQFPTALPSLTGTLVHLRELGEQDIEPWFERATDAESADLAGDSVPASISLGAAWLQRHRDSFSKRLGLRWAIVPSGALASVGTIGLTLKPSEGQWAELGVVVARAWWNKGLASEAARLVTRYAFEEVRMHEIRAQVLERNHPSIRLLEKAGFHLVRALPPSTAEPEAMLLYALSRRCLSAA